MNSQVQNIRGVAPKIVSRIAGTGTVGLVTKVAGKRLAFFYNVLYILGEEYGLVSQGHAVCQIFLLRFDETSQVFSVLLEDRVVAVARPQYATCGFQAA